MTNVRSVASFFAWEKNVDFQVNEETYFLDLSEDAGQWLVFVETPTGARQIPVYVDTNTGEDSLLLVDRQKNNIVN